MATQDFLPACAARFRGGAVVRRAAGRAIGAAYIVASLYERGEGVPQDLNRAWHWYREAANSGDPAAVIKAREMREKLPR